MGSIDLRYLCTTIGNLSGIPVRIFEGRQLTFYYSQIRLPRDPMLVYQNEIFAMQSHVGYVTTRHFHYYGIVNSGSTRIVIGPTRQTEESEQELRELLAVYYEQDVSHESYDSVDGERYVKEG